MFLGAAVRLSHMMHFCLINGRLGRENLVFTNAISMRTWGGLMALVRQHETPYVINFAAQSMVAESWQNPGDWFTTNAVSTVS
jgi:UDP-glucose 4-epimerase